MMMSKPVPLVRRFSRVPASLEASDEQHIQELFGFSEATTWEAIDKGYRSVVLAEAGAGKTFEMLARATFLERQDRPAFFIRIEEIEDDFQQSFEVGNAGLFEQWLGSVNDAWFYLDSVDEARLENPTTFKRAIRRFGSAIREAQHRAHVCISSRPYAWRPQSDRELIERYLPLPQRRVEAAGENLEATDSSESEEAVEVFVLQPLDENDIRQFAQHRSVPDIDPLIRDLDRMDLMSLAGRPFDLEAILDKWACDRTLGGRSDLLSYNVSMRLQEPHDPDRALRQSLNLRKALAGAKRLAAAVVLTGDAGIQVPDAVHTRTGIDAAAVLSDWDLADVRALLERAIFDDVIYGAVRFRHRDVREFLAAGWFSELLQRGRSRLEIESLFFREEYGHQFIAPRLRVVLPWLILDDNGIRSRTLAEYPEVSMEGGDPVRLPLPMRESILSEVVGRLVRNEDYGAAGENSALARIAHPDLTGRTLALIDQFPDSDEVLFFLGRLVWQGAMSECVARLVPVAADPTREVYVRIAATHAVTTCGTEEQRRALWDALLTGDADMPRELLADLVEAADETAVPKVLESIEKLSPDSDYSQSRLTSAMHEFAHRLPLPSRCAVHAPISALISGLHGFLHRTPAIDPGSCDISEHFAWLLGPAMDTIGRLVVARSELALAEHVLALLRSAPTTQHWRAHDFDDRNNKLSELVPGWTELNDALFWYCVATARTERQARGLELRDDWPLQWPDPYWAFGANSFPRVLDWVRTRESEDDQLVALSLAFRIFRQAQAPPEWLDCLRTCVGDDTGLVTKLEELVNPVVSEAELKSQREWAEHQRSRERRRRETAQQRSDWLARLKADPDLVRNPPRLPPGECSPDQLLLLREVEHDDLRTNRSEGAAWQTLTDEFGEHVAYAYREAAMAHWRSFRPELRSEGGDTRTIPYSLVFAMAGLAIEADEVEEFPRHLSAAEVRRALRYAVYELNGFPRWLQTMYEEWPEAVLEAVVTELLWELESAESDGPMHYILHDLAFYAPWLHGTLAGRLLCWIRDHDLPRDDALDYSLRILRGAGLDPSQLVLVAKAKAMDHSSDHCAHWYAVWADAEPETGVEAVTTWLDGLESEEGSRLAQLFITTLMGNRRDAGSGADIGKFQTSTYLKSLYILMHRHIRATEDIDRSGGGVYSPGLRDDAQEARERLFSLLSETPGKEAYVVLSELIEEHPHSNFRPRMESCARRRAEQDGDLEPWTAAQVAEFSERLTRTPTSQRQLLDLTFARITDLKNWVQRGHDSPYRTWQKADDEGEVRNLVVGWLNQRWGNPFTVAQEPELANSQRMDIWLQNQSVPSPVPIELKLLDKDWTGPQLCERLRNQLVGDYMREATGGCGLMLLVWQGNRPDKRWKIDGRMVPLQRLSDALKEYWHTISNSFPHVEAVEVVLIDLTQRARRSCDIHEG